MTVKDLIQKLQEYPEDLEVGVRGCVFKRFMSGNSEHDEKFNSDITFRVIGTYNSPDSIEDYRMGKMCDKDIEPHPWMKDFRRVLCLS